MGLLGVVYAFGIWITLFVSSYRFESTEQKPPQADALLYKHYGSLPRTMFTLFLSITNGIAWGEVASPLSSINFSVVAILIVYIALALFGLLNILTSVFVESALEATQHYKELMIEESENRRKKYCQHLRHIFYAIDKDGSGTITKGEMMDFIASELPQLHEYFNALGVDTSNLTALFKLLDYNDSGDIDISEFCTGCLRLKGEAKSFDVNLLIYEIRRLRNKIE